MNLNKKILFIFCVFLFLGTSFNYASASIQSCTFKCPDDSPTASGENITITSSEGVARAIEIWTRILTNNCGYFPASQELIANWSTYLVSCECAESTSAENAETFDAEEGVCRFPEGETATPEGEVAAPTPAAGGTATQKTLPITGIDLPTPLGTTSVPILLGRIIKGILGIVGSIALLMFIYGGFLWLTSRGNTEMVEKGKNTLIYATIGLAIIFFSYAVVDFVISSITGFGS